MNNAFIPKVSSGNNYKIFVIRNKITTMNYIGYTTNSNLRNMMFQRINLAKPNTKFYNDLEYTKNSIINKNDILKMYDLELLEELECSTPIETVVSIKTAYIIKYNSFYNGLNEDTGNLLYYEIDDFIETIRIMFARGMSVTDIANNLYRPERMIVILLEYIGIDPNIVLISPPFMIDPSFVKK